MSDQDGMNISSELRKLSASEASVPADEWVPSSSEAEELLEQATTVLRRAVEAAWKVHAREAFHRLHLDPPTTLVLGAASPFTQRLTHFSGLIQSHAEELSSIAQTNPVTDVDDSSRGQGLTESSPLTESESSDIERFPLVTIEPPEYSVVIDSGGDVWQRRYNGWACAVGNNDAYSGWTWERLNRAFPGLRLVYEEDD